ncbi:hypothetical protein ACFYY2_33785 [Streptomyces sp. NPDC001822]|uniref:hypothetical protein n=1 Tax=Streptomyces sp. NPDC001822 TaxID=3364614 RepID=UPI0036B29D3E
MTSLMTFLPLSRHACVDQELLRVAVLDALEGHPVGEWTVRFADVIINNRDEPFAKRFFDRSVARGVREAFGESGCC